MNVTLPNISMKMKMLLMHQRYPHQQKPARKGCFLYVALLADDLHHGSSAPAWHSSHRIKVFVQGIGETDHKIPAQ
jgi:hypothetical protein